MVASGKAAIIWRLRGKLTQIVFLQQRPRAIVAKTPVLRWTIGRGALPFFIQKSPNSVVPPLVIRRAEDTLGIIIWLLRAKLFQPIFFRQLLTVSLPPVLPWITAQAPFNPYAKSRATAFGILPPVVHELKPLPTKNWTISGITKDSAGVALPFCTVKLYRTADNVVINSTTSGADGSFSFSGLGQQDHYEVAYLVGNPDVAGTTTNTLRGS